MIAIQPPLLMSDEGPETEPLRSIHQSFYDVHSARIRHATSLVHPNIPMKRITLRKFPLYLAQVSPEPESERQAQAPHLLQLTSAVALPPLDYKDCHRILDLGCRRGDWALDMARRNPSTWILGIDEDQSMISRAETQALTEGLANIEFRVGDITQSCAAGIKGYEERPFDLIHASFIATSIDHRHFSEFIYGMTRCTAPGGIIQWTEMELPITNSRYVERFNRFVSEALQLTGHAFSAANTIGITPLMASWLTQYNCRILHDVAHSIDISYGTKMRDAYLNYMDHFGRMMRFYVIGTGVATPTEYAETFDKALADVVSISFCGLCYVRTLVVTIPVGKPKMVS